MNHPRLLLQLVMLLLLSNIGLALFLFLKGKGPSGRYPRSNEAIEAEVKKELGLTDEQAIQFRGMLKNNRDSLKKRGAALQEAKNNYYALLQQTQVEDSLLQARGSVIAARQIAFDQQMFSHFFEVRKMLTDAQKPTFDSMVMRIINRPEWMRRKGR